MDKHWKDRLDEIDWENITMDDVANAVEKACDKAGISASEFIPNNYLEGSE